MCMRCDRRLIPKKQHMGTTIYIYTHINIYTYLHTHIYTYVQIHIHSFRSARVSRRAHCSANSSETKGAKQALKFGHLHHSTSYRRGPGSTRPVAWPGRGPAALQGLWQPYSYSQASSTHTATARAVGTPTASEKGNLKPLLGGSFS